jgi:ketosteroid isomerase-like protein
MQQIHRLAIFLILLLSASATPAQESAANDHAAAWATVENMWAAEERGGDDWADEMLSADFMGWSNASPAPRSKSSTRMWARFNADQTKGLTHELYPLSIVVHGDTAVLHYLYTMAVQTKDKKTVLSNGRFTDILVRDGTDWKFLSWHGGDDE